MSYLSATENVGFSGIQQNISDASCATQYKMAVEGAAANCSEVMYIPDNSADDSTYISHLNDNYFTKFKIDPNDLYTFHDSDVIAGEITVSHTEDTFMFPDSVDAKPKSVNNLHKDLNILGAFTNGDVKEGIKKKVFSNGLCSLKSVQKDTKTSNTKAQKAKNQFKEARRESFSEARKKNVPTSKSQTVTVSSSSAKSSISNINTTNTKSTVPVKQSGSETFLDVFKREQGLVENEEVVVKTEPQSVPVPVPLPVKTPATPPKKSSGKTPLQPKARRGRGPAVHEALQRISAPKKAIPIPNRRWHAPGDNLFECGPLDNKILAFRVLESSSSDDDNMPDFESDSGSVRIEESEAESRGARLALRRAALRRHVARAHDTLRLAPDYKDQKILASVIKKQLTSNKTSLGNLPTPTVNHLLAMRGMPTVLSPQERKKLRECGWSGADSVSSTASGTCAEATCTRQTLPCAQHCLAHVTSLPSQRLYAACAAVFAGGARCKAPLLPLRGQTPLCAEHAWKRDNYDKLVKDTKPKKIVRPRVMPAPRRPKRRRRPPPRPRFPAPPTAEQSLSEINVCSNSSAYDSADEATMGALSDEYVAVASHELEVEVGHIPADDILDPAVLNHIPDDAFTEFFTEGIVLEDGETTFGEGGELAAVLEAALDERGFEERGLDERIEERTIDEHEVEDSGLRMDHTVFNHSMVNGQMQVPASVPLELSSSATS